MCLLNCYKKTNKTSQECQMKGKTKPQMKNNFNNFGLPSLISHKPNTVIGKLLKIRWVISWRRLKTSWRNRKARQFRFMCASSGQAPWKNSLSLLQCSRRLSKARKFPQGTRIMGLPVNSCQQNHPKCLNIRLGNAEWKRTIITSQLPKI